MQFVFSAATAGSVGRGQTQVRAAALLADGAYWIAGGAYRTDLFPHRSFRRMQLKVVRQRARADKGYDIGQGLRVPWREPPGAVIGTTRPCMESLGQNGGPRLNFLPPAQPPPAPGRAVVSPSPPTSHHTFSSF